MVDFYEGIDDFPVDFPEVDDSSTPQASDFNPAYEALADRTVWLRNRVGLASALNWCIGETDLFTDEIVFNEEQQAWFAMPGPSAPDRNQFASVYDEIGTPIEWNTDASSIGDFLGSIAARVSGDMIALTTSRAVKKATFSSHGNITWTTYSNALAVAPSGGSIAFDEDAAASAGWIACYRDSTNGMSVETSTTGETAFTPRTVPAEWSGYAGENNPELAAVPGSVIAVFYDESSGEIQTMHSEDGGITWANVSIAFADPGPAPFITKPAYNAHREEWYFAIGFNDGLRQTNVYRSTNGGASWTLVDEITTSDFLAHDLACDGAVCVMISEDGRMAYSTDRGASWLHFMQYPHTVASSRWRVRQGGGGFCAANDQDGNALFSVRVGPGRELL